MPFPTYTFTPKVDNVDTVFAADINELQAAIEEIAARGGVAFPMHPDVWYDNGTAISGLMLKSPAISIVPDTIKAGLIKVSDAGLKITGVGVADDTGGFGASTFRVGLYDASNGGLPGLLIADFGNLTIDDAPENGIAFKVVNQAIDPGYYWIGLSATVSRDLPYNIERMIDGAPNMLGTRNAENYNPFGVVGISVSSSGAQTAMPNDLTAVVTASSRSTAAPQVLFKVGPV